MNQLQIRPLQQFVAWNTRHSRARFCGRILLTLTALLISAGCTPSKQVAIRSINDVANARIGVTTGSTPAQLAYARFPDADINEFGDSTDSLGALKAGHIDVTITSINAALLTVRMNPDLAIVDAPLREEDTCAAVRKGNYQLLAQVNQVIREIRADGTLADMRRRWFKHEPGPYETRDYPTPASGKPLRVGVNATSEPFAFMDENGAVSGHDGELARLISARLQRPLEFVNTRWDGLIPALQAGKIDIIVSGMSYTDERAKRVDFTENYYANKLVLLARAIPEDVSAPPGAVRGLADLKTAKLGVVQGSAHDVFAQQRFPDAQLLQFNTYADLLIAVQAGRVTAGLSDIDPLRQAMREKPQFRLIDEPLFTSQVAAGFRQDDQELRGEFDSFLKFIADNGVHAELLQRWLEEDNFDMPDLPQDQNAPPLYVANAFAGLPQVAMKDGRLVGLDVELALRFGRHSGRRIEFVTADWPALIPALVSGKVDTVISSMFITPERRKRIAFSQPYYQVENFAFVYDAKVTIDGGERDHANGSTLSSFWQATADSFYSNLILEDRYLFLWDGLKVTVWLSIFSTLLGTALGALVCFMRMSPVPTLRGPAVVYISIMRGVPVLVLLMLIFYVIFASVQISPVVVAIIAFGLHFSAYVAEIFRAGVQSIDKGQMEAGVSLGFSRVSSFRHIVLPQTIQRILPVYRGEFISLVKMTSVVGYVAVQDLTKASDIIRSRTFDAFFPLIVVAILYYLISSLLGRGLKYVERQTDPQQRRLRSKR